MSGELQAIRYKDGQLELLDQLLLPHTTKYFKVNNVVDGCRAIKQMQVRGAAAIAIAGCLSLATELHQMQPNGKTAQDFIAFIAAKTQSLVDARPTAVNIKTAAIDIDRQLRHWLSQTNTLTAEQLKQRLIEYLEKMPQIDIDTNKVMGDHGARHIIESAKRRGRDTTSIITHCNTGTLATAGYGSALGVVRSLHKFGKLDDIYSCETRPYNQGARLTCYELVWDRIQPTLICDNMAAWLMKNRQISAIVVGADRIVANGDTANKIGTFQLAILAKHFDVPFYVAAPTTTIDMAIADGSGIVVEERPHAEMTHINGTRIAAEGIKCWNPSFDVTPSHLITGGVITEKGVVPANQLHTIM